jgi:hypothetical protein
MYEILVAAGADINTTTANGIEHRQGARQSPIRFIHTQEQRMFQILALSWKAQGGIIMPYLHRSFIDKRPSTAEETVRSTAG